MFRWECLKIIFWSLNLANHKNTFLNFSSIIPGGIMGIRSYLELLGKGVWSWQHSDTPKICCTVSTKGTRGLQVLYSDNDTILNILRNPVSIKMSSHHRSFLCCLFHLFLKTFCPLEMVSLKPGCKTRATKHLTDRSDGHRHGGQAGGREARLSAEGGGVEEGEGEGEGGPKGHTAGCTLWTGKPSIPLTSCQLASTRHCWLLPMFSSSFRRTKECPGLTKKFHPQLV